MNSNFSLILLATLIVYSCTGNNEPKNTIDKTKPTTEIPTNNKEKRNNKIIKETAFLFSIEMKNRNDLLQNKNWRKFDSVWYKWESDTLLLNHIRFVKNVCGDYELKSSLINDTLLLSLVDSNQCELATILETNSKIIIDKSEDLIIKFNNEILIDK